MAPSIASVNISWPTMRAQSSDVGSSAAASALKFGENRDFFVEFGVGTTCDTFQIID